MSDQQLSSKPMLVVFTGAMAVTAMVLTAVTWTRVQGSVESSVAAQNEWNLWEELLSTLKDAETGQRGYVITGDRSYLEPFEQANLRVGDVIAALRANENSVEADIARIEDLVVKRIDLLKEVAVVREREGLNPARDLILRGEGKVVMDALREGIGNEIRRNRTLALEKSATVSQELRLGYISAIGAGVVALGSGLVAFLLFQDALAHARRERRLAEEKRAAESADRDKSAFLATMSHEIRTPMNAILGFADLLRERLSDERDRKYVDSILSGGRSLLQLINDILDLSKVEAGMLKLNPEPTDLRATAEFVRQLFANLCFQRGVELRAELDENLPRSVLFDNLRLRQILINVVGNAVKFTNSGHISLRFRGEPDGTDLSHLRVVVEIEDTGCGIPEDRIGSIFKPFVQAGAAENKAGVPGTGLGLAIVDRLTHLMGGEISVESEVGKGTCFRFNFPGVEVSSRLANSLLGAEDEAVDFDEFRPSTILVADDNPTNLELLSGIFEGTKHRLLLARDGEEAVAAAIEGGPDLVLMDVRMPNKDGLEALGEIRAEDRLHLLPVIAVTASSLGCEDAETHGKFDGYLRKPFSRAELHREIAQFIPRTESHQDGTASDLPGEVPATREAVEKWRWLAGVLAVAESEDLPALSASMSVSDIEAFAARLRSLAEEAGCDSLARYAVDLETGAASFSPDLIERTLGRFPAVVAAIRAATGPA